MLYIHKSSDNTKAGLGSMFRSNSIAKPTSSNLNARLCGFCLCKHRSCKMASACRYSYGWVLTMLMIMKIICSFLCLSSFGLTAGRLRSW